VDREIVPPTQSWTENVPPTQSWTDRMYLLHRVGQRECTSYTEASLKSVFILLLTRV
jgi:hypothetical protein